MSKGNKGAIRPAGGKTTTQAPALATADVGVLSAAQVESLVTAQVQAMTTAEIKALAPDALAAMSTDQIVAMLSGTTDAAPALTTEAVAALDTTQAAALTTGATDTPAQTPDVAPLTTVQVDALPDWIKNAKPPAPDVAAVTMPGFTAIEYVGKRPEYVDGAYGTRLLFKRGESKWVPNDVAKKMLKHPDVYELGDIPTAPAIKVPAKQHQKEEEDLQDLRDSIANMDKASLAQYAKIHYGQDVDAKVSLAEVRQQVTMLVDQYGIA